MADENDDLLDPAEIEALLNSQMGIGPSVPANSPAAPSAFTPPAAGASGGEALSQEDLDELFRQVPRPVSSTARPAAAAPASRSVAAPPPDKLLEQVEADLAAALSPGGGSRQRPLPSGARSYEFEQFSSGAASEESNSLQALQEVEVDIRIELGRTELLIEEVLKLREGSVVPLDKLAGDPVDILVNGRLIARGEVLVLNDNFCVRVAEILAPSL